MCLGYEYGAACRFVAPGWGRSGQTAAIRYHTTGPAAPACASMRPRQTRPSKSGLSLGLAPQAARGGRWAALSTRRRPSVGQRPRFLAASTAGPARPRVGPGAGKLGRRGSATARPPPEALRSPRRHGAQGAQGAQGTQGPLRPQATASKHAEPARACATRPRLPAGQAPVQREACSRLRLNLFRRLLGPFSSGPATTACTLAIVVPPPPG